MGLVAAVVEVDAAVVVGGVGGRGHLPHLRGSRYSTHWASCGDDGERRRTSGVIEEHASGRGLG